MGRRNKNLAKGENTVIGAGTVISGGVTSDSMVMRIDGQIEGGINTKGDLIIGEKGTVNGDVKASSLTLAGVVNGNVDAVNKITIEAGGKLYGNINTELLAIDETAILQGNVNMKVNLAKEDVADAVEADTNKVDKKKKNKEEAEVVKEAEEDE
ncbi:MAG: polymer-forming cytoskeletal protein [Lachnospiraceae bacterium]|nr:polymer-forming cytoskeletal protein [Candidatus Colinaster scatohippi]